MKLLKALRWPGSTDRQNEAENPLATSMGRIVPKCLVCGARPEGHRFAQIASLPIDEEHKDQVARLFYDIRAHRWDRLRGLDEFKGGCDDAIAYLVTGPHPQAMVVFIRDPVDPYARVEIYAEEVITEEETEQLRSFLPERAWHNFLGRS